LKNWPPKTVDDDLEFSDEDMLLLAVEFQENVQIQPIDLRPNGKKMNWLH